MAKRPMTDGEDDMDAPGMHGHMVKAKKHGHKEMHGGEHGHASMSESKKHGHKSMHNHFAKGGMIKKMKRGGMDCED